MEKTKQRIGWIDVTKGIAILLVILGHSLVGLKINDYIFAFHMPVFFITSGILFRQKSIPAVIKKNAQKLLIPYGITAVFVIIGRAASAYIQHWTPEIIKSLCINTAIGSLFGFGVDEVRWFFPVWRIGAIWFLLAFFWSTLFMQLVFHATKQWQEWQRAILVITVSTLSYIFGQYLWIPTNADIGGFAFLFVYAGYLFSKVQIWEKKKLPVVCWLLVAVVYVCAAHIGGINMVIRYVPNYAAIPGALAGSLLLIKLSTYMEHWKKCAKILIWYGRNSMKILCVHLFEMMIIPWGYFAQWLGLADTRLTTIVLRTLFITIGVLIINGIVRGVKKIQTF